MASPRSANPKRISSYLPEVSVLKPQDAHIDFKRLGSHADGYGLVLLLAVANLNVLILLPWKNATPYSGFPTARLLRIAQLGALSEDIPQLILQMIYLSTADTGDNLTISIVSVCFSVLSLLLRLLRKLLVGLSAYLASLPEGQAPPLMVTLSHSASTMLGVDLDVSKGEAKLGECGRV
eukprot:6164174-Prymnesium_polylepis.1